MSLAAAGHVVDEWAIDVGATGTDPIQQGFEVGHEILGISQLFINYLRVAGLAQHHQAPRNSNCFSSCASGHAFYTDPF